MGAKLSGNCALWLDYDVFCDIMLLKSVFLWMVCVRNWCLVFYDVEIKWILDFVIWNMVFGYLSLIFLLSVLMRLSELLFYVVRHNVIVNWVCCSEVLEYGDESYWTCILDFGELVSCNVGVKWILWMCVWVYSFVRCVCEFRWNL